MTQEILIPLPVAALAPNTVEFDEVPLVKPTGFREYDARWWFGVPNASNQKAPELNLMGVTALGLGLGTYLHQRGAPRVVVAHDFRAYSLSIKQALTLGLLQAGCEVFDIGLAVSPMAYFAQFELNVPSVAMVTASHNDNGWTGIKMGCDKPLTFGPDEIGVLKEIVLQGKSVARAGGQLHRISGMAEKYIGYCVAGTKIQKPLKVVVACGNGTAGAFAPAALRQMGAEVIELDCNLDYNFPNYPADPENQKMLHAMAHAVKEHNADCAFGFDGDGDRFGLVDDTGDEIFADKTGLLLARDLAALHPGAKFVVDVKSTGLYQTDAVLAQHGCSVDYWKTGHSYIKRRVHELGALAGFEKSGHLFFAQPYGNGYDDALVSARMVLNMLARSGKKLSELKAELPVAYTSMTMQASTTDERKYDLLAEIIADYQKHVAAGGKILGRAVRDVNTVNGIRITLDDGSWVLVRCSSNTPTLVVVVESTQSAADMRALFHEEVKPRLAQYKEIGGYNQEV